MVPEMYPRKCRVSLGYYRTMWDAERAERQAILGVSGFIGMALEGKMVPGDRIELPTRGFSIPCSTD
jgi:hypothetical protein